MRRDIPEGGKWTQRGSDRRRHTLCLRNKNGINFPGLEGSCGWVRGRGYRTSYGATGNLGMK